MPGSVASGTPCISSEIDERMSIVPGCNENSNKNQNARGIPSQCHIVHPKSHMSWPGMTPRQLRNFLINCMSKNLYLRTGAMLQLSLDRWNGKCNCFVFGSIRFLHYGRECLHILLPPFDQIIPLRPHEMHHHFPNLVQ
jgi:hypothetical protein